MPREHFTTVQEYFAALPEKTHEKLTQLWDTIKQEVPAEAEEVISYNIPCFKLNGKYLIYAAGYEHHVSIYPIPAGNEEFTKKVEPYIKGKGTLQFQLSEPLPTDLIKEVVHLAIEANLHRTQKY